MLAFKGLGAGLLLVTAILIATTRALTARANRIEGRLLEVDVRTNDIGHYTARLTDAEGLLGKSMKNNEKAMTETRELNEAGLRRQQGEFETKIGQLALQINALASRLTSVEEASVSRDGKLAEEVAKIDEVLVPSAELDGRVDAVLARRFGTKDDQLWLQALWKKVLVQAAIDISGAAGSKGRATDIFENLLHKIDHEMTQQPTLFGADTAQIRKLTSECLARLDVEEVLDVDIPLVETLPFVKQWLAAPGDESEELPKELVQLLTRQREKLRAWMAREGKQLRAAVQSNDGLRIVTACSKLIDHVHTRSLEPGTHQASLKQFMDLLVQALQGSSIAVMRPDKGYVVQGQAGEGVEVDQRLTSPERSGTVLQVIACGFKDETSGGILKPARVFVSAGRPGSGGTA